MVAPLGLRSILTLTGNHTLSRTLNIKLQCYHETSLRTFSACFAYFAYFSYFAYSTYSDDYDTDDDDVD